MKYLYLSLFLLFSLTANSHGNIELLYQNKDYIPQEQFLPLEFIDAKMDISSEIKIAEYRLTMSKKGTSISDVYKDFCKIALKAGANSFAVEDVNTDDSKYIVTVIVYNLSDERMEENFSYYEDNLVGIFGYLNTKNMKRYMVPKVNGEKVKVFPHSYVKYKIEPGGEIKIKFGGLAGSAVTIRGERNKYPRCFSLDAETVLPTGGVAYSLNGRGGGIGLFISTGSIHPMEAGFGLFMMAILPDSDVTMR